jgi:hypothetical protein
MMGKKVRHFEGQHDGDTQRDVQKSDNWERLLTLVL